MTDTNGATAPVDDFDFGSLDAQDELVYAIKHPQTEKPTTWLWTLYGPGHPVTVALADKISREVLEENRRKQQTITNGKKWKEEERDPHEIMAEAVENVLARVKHFTTVRINGEEFEFSKETARKLLSDRRKGYIFAQISAALRDDANFITPSGKT